MAFHAATWDLVLINQPDERLDMQRATSRFGYLRQLRSYGYGYNEALAVADVWWNREGSILEADRREGFERTGGVARRPTLNEVV